MSKRGQKELLLDILEAIDRVFEYSANMSLEQFLKDGKTQDAVVRNFEIIGEATKNISEEIKSQSQEVEWKKLAGLRDKIIHFYFGVNWDIVWDIVKSKLPRLKGQISAILENS
ncbi:MAG: DUF86 domain-containing protein [bacterium]